MVTGIEAASYLEMQQARQSQESALLHGRLRSLAYGRFKIGPRLCMGTWHLRGTQLLKWKRELDAAGISNMTLLSGRLTLCPLRL